jgi:hypothetical protein
MSRPSERTPAAVVEAVVEDVVEDVRPAWSTPAIQKGPDQLKAAECLKACQRAHELLLRLGIEPV